MTIEELRPYLGSRCHLAVRCRACRARHVLIGTPELARYLGDITLLGQSFSVEDIEQAWKLAGPPPRRRLLASLSALVRTFKRALRTAGGIVVRGGLKPERRPAPL
jgi:hypothetical protein